MSGRARNIIYITSDEMRGDAPAFMGNADCRTPCLDKFAERATVFNQHFTVHGKCVPSRVAMMTGRYPHTDGFRTIHQHLHPEQPNVLRSVKRAGYETAVFGVNHVWENFWGTNHKSSGCVDYHSFTEEYFAPMLKREWPAPSPHPGSPETLSLPDGLHYHGRVTKAPTGFCDHNKTEQAIRYLTEVRDRSRPFFLHVNLGLPHPPYEVEEPFFSQYDRKNIRAWPHELPKNAPLNLKVMRDIRSGGNPKEEWLREIQAVYYGMVSRVDSHVGSILAAIEHEKLFDDTLIVFTADHGDFAGQYGLPEKWDTCMADCILRVPMIVHAPGLRPGTKINSLTEHTDLAPTMLECLGLKADWDIHGTSMLPIVEGVKHKDAVFADGGHEETLTRCFGAMDHDTFSQLIKRVDGKQQTYRESPDTMSRTMAVRTDKWKLVVRLTGGNELYDLSQDPWELNNLHGNRDLMPVICELQSRLLDWRLRTDTDRPVQEQWGA